MNNEPKINNRFLIVSILVSAGILAGALIYNAGLKNVPRQANLALSLEEIVLPAKETLPVRWGDLGAKMISAGVIDIAKLESVYADRGGLSKENEKLLTSTTNGRLVITPENSGFILNLFWALGLSNKNDILDNGPMSDSRYGGADTFASTGGWTLAKGDVMDHYSRHSFVSLTPEQQALVEKVSKNIYRPCCNNSAYFPDCNHGMAMLGLLELMASQGISEEEMYQVALKVNAYWFPENYLTIAKYLESKGVIWNEVKPQEILGANYSSGSGYRRVLSQMTSPVKKSDGGCSI